MNRIRFKLVPFDGDPVVQCVVPLVDGTPLTHLVGAGHAGLIWAWFNFGRPSNHFRGIDTWNGDPDRVALLGCACGEWGCDPFEVNIVLTDELVRWTNPSIGTFQFDRGQYEFELAGLDAKVGV